MGHVPFPTALLFFKTHEKVVIDESLLFVHKNIIQKSLLFVNKNVTKFFYRLEV